MNSEQKEIWADWMKERPAHVREIVEQFPPWKLFRLNGRQIVFVLQYDEEMEGDNVTMTVAVREIYNLETQNIVTKIMAMENRNVFGVKLDDLEDINQERDFEKENEDD